MPEGRWQHRLLGIRSTTTFRLTAMLGVAFLCAMCLLLGLIYVLTERELIGRTDELLAYQAKAFASVPAPRLPQSVRAAILNDTSHLNYFALLDTNGHELTGDFVPPHSLRVVQTVELPPCPNELPALRMLQVPMAGGMLLVIGRDITQIVDLRRRILTILLAGGGIASLLILLVAVALSAAPLRRVRALTALATRIAAGELTLRMPVTERNDELDVIATTVNSMIEEIARLLQQVKGATDAIAHDLRSPLADLRIKLVQIRIRASSGHDEFPVLGRCAGNGTPEVTANSALRLLIDNALEDLDMVLARFGALLRIAELEATNRQACFAELDPMALASSVCELFQPLAEDRAINLMLSGPWGHIIRGDEKLLFEVISNLVENAIKFIAPGGTVAVGVIADGGATVLVVRDDGPGIPTGERASVLRRYYRGSSAQHSAGSGLGLSLVAEIVHLHGYALQLDDANPGLEVRIICQSSAKIN